ncbi:MAG: hypothetical protein QW273_01115 [Candidatus Pacearchaeota archaeon]
MKEFNPFIPLYFMNTAGVMPEERSAALSALYEVLQIASVISKIPLIDLGIWREKNYRNSKKGLLPHKSVDWYINIGYNSEREQVNVNEGLVQLLLDPLNKKNPHYDIILTIEDLYTPSTDFVVGSTLPRRGAIISVNRFRKINDKRIREETLKQEVFHEAGHLFGLPNINRREDIDETINPHCTNCCAMKRVVNVPSDLINLAKDRKETGKVYCWRCLDDLRNYFNII